MGLKKVFGQFLGTKHIVTSFEKFHFNSGLKMKDLAGLLSEEKNYVTEIFLGCYGYCGEKTGRINRMVLFLRR